MALRSSLYLIRFDDICPSMNWRMWDHIQSFLEKEQIKPLLAVVPDNRDPKLMKDRSNPEFWARMTSLANVGWSIALHGYRHEYLTRNPGILRIKPDSEFAGLPLEIQREKIKSGLRICADHGLSPTVWVAPSHSFDWNTVLALRENGIMTISDGLWDYPHRDDDGVFWIPQQLFGGFCEKRRGVWTVNFHHNEWSGRRLEQFEGDVKRFRERIEGFSKVESLFEKRRKTICDSLSAKLRWFREHRMRSSIQWGRSLIRP